MTFLGINCWKITVGKDLKKKNVVWKSQFRNYAKDFWNAAQRKIKGIVSGISTTLCSRITNCNIDTHFFISILAKIRENRKKNEKEILVTMIAHQLFQNNYFLLNLLIEKEKKENPEIIVIYKGETSFL